jgi:hypothetical protein
MICNTVRDGAECTFMKAKGCSYSGGSCREIIEQCRGCGKNIKFGEGLYCSAYPDPAKKWAAGNCNFATHIAKKEAEKKAKINPLKASKRSKKG